MSRRAGAPLDGSPIPPTVTEPVDQGLKATHEIPVLSGQALACACLEEPEAPCQLREISDFAGRTKRGVEETDVLALCPPGASFHDVAGRRYRGASDLRQHPEPFALRKPSRLVVDLEDEVVSQAGDE